MIIDMPPRRKAGGFASRIKPIGRFVASTRFFSGFAVALLLATGYQSMSAKEPALCPIPLAAVATPEPEPEPLTGETMFVASEFADVQYGPTPRRSAPPKKLLVRFDTHRKCLQVRDQTSGVFIPDGCIVYGDTVRNKKRFDQQYARVGRDEVRWKAEESVARYR